jgi:hypothetical protein
VPRHAPKTLTSLLMGFGMLAVLQLSTAHAVYTCMSGDTVAGKALLFNTLPFKARLEPICG